MKRQEFQERFFDREKRYPDWQLLPGDRTLHIQVEGEYAATYAGQTAAITAASLFGRMSQSVAVDVPSLPVLASLPWSGEKLDDIVMRTLNAANFYGRYEQRVVQHDDIPLIIGSGGDGLVVHGCGWGAYCGLEKSLITESDEPNPYGAAFAVVMAAARLQQFMLEADFESLYVDTYLWKAGPPSLDIPAVSDNFELGEIWCIGVGSVGSCALFFLRLATCSFDAVLVDRDKVKIENISRSALFSWCDVRPNNYKVEVASRWLNAVGVESVEPHIAWLDEIPERWNKRPVGTPDILIATANEREVRSVIEAGFPPLQVYATTGHNWQATLFRHLPLCGPCSLCVPGTDTPQLSMLCATSSLTPSNNHSRGDDVALPFLSYAAGLMTAAEIVKLSIVGEPVTPNRVFFEPRAHNMVRSVSLRQKDACICRTRDIDTHMEAIRGSRYTPMLARSSVPFSDNPA